MTTSVANTSSTNTRPEPRTADELLDREEALALQRLATSVQNGGEELCSALRLRETVRAHPYASTGVAALAGYALGPLIPRMLQVVIALQGLKALQGRRGAGGGPIGPSLVWNSLRALRQYVPRG